MFINWSEWKMIQVFNSVDCIEPKNLSISFNDISEAKRSKTLEGLIKKNILHYFWVGSAYSDYSSYNLSTTGKKIARRGYLKHNAIELFTLIDKHKAWIPIVVGFIGLMIAIRKC